MGEYLFSYTPINDGEGGYKIALFEITDKHKTAMQLTPLDINESWIEDGTKLCCFVVKGQVKDSFMVRIISTKSSGACAIDKRGKLYYYIEDRIIMFDSKSLLPLTRASSNFFDAIKIGIN